jgi:hypothetical protein
LDYFGKNGLPTSDPGLVARVRVTARVRASPGVAVQEVRIRSLCSTTVPTMEGKIR